MTVRWASIWAGDQYIVRYGGRLTTSPFRTTSTSMSRPSGRARREVGERLRVLAGQVDPRGVEGSERGDPGRDRRGERLAEERPERHVLPGLDVARRPVVEADDAEDVVGEVARGDRRPQALAPPTTKPSSASMSRRVLGPKTGPRCRPLTPALAAGADDRRAARHDGAAAAVVADRQVPPVGQQRLLVGTEDPAHVGGVVERGVEVDVVADRERHPQLDLVERHQVGLDEVALGLVGDQARPARCGWSPTPAGPGAGTR